MVLFMSVAAVAQAGDQRDLDAKIAQLADARKGLDWCLSFCDQKTIQNYRTDIARLEKEISALRRELKQQRQEESED